MGWKGCMKVRKRCSMGWRECTWLKCQWWFVVLVRKGVCVVVIFEICCMLYAVWVGDSMQECVNVWYGTNPEGWEYFIALRKAISKH